MPKNDFTYRAASIDEVIGDAIYVANNPWYVASLCTWSAQQLSETDATNIVGAAQNTLMTMNAVRHQG